MVKNNNLVVRNAAVKTLHLNSPFEGLNVALCSIFNVTQSSIVQSLLIDPSKIKIKLQNRDTGVFVFDLSLTQLSLFCEPYKLNQHKAYNVSAYLPSFGVAPYFNSTPNFYSNLMELSFKFPHVYSGNYELTIDMKDSIPLGSATSSYLSLSPMVTDELPMFETIIDFKSVNRPHNNISLGSGIERVILMNKFSIFSLLQSSFSTFCKRFEYLNVFSDEFSNEYSLDEARCLTNSFFDDRNISDNLKIPFLTLHEGELISNARVVVKNLTPNADDYLIFSRLVPYKNASSLREISEYSNMKVISKIPFNKSVK